MNRRGFLLNVVKTSGVTAALVAMDHRGILALPNYQPTADGWKWNGEAPSYLAELTRRFQREYALLAGNALPLLPLEERSPYGGGAWRQFNTAWSMPSEWRLREERLSPAVPPPDAKLVMAGCVACFHHFPPEGCIGHLAREFATMVIEAGVAVAAPMELPLGVAQAHRNGPFRLVGCYDVVSDHLLTRIDLLGTRKDS